MPLSAAQSPVVLGQRELLPPTCPVQSALEPVSLTEGDSCSQPAQNPEDQRVYLKAPQCPCLEMVGNKRANFCGCLGLNGFIHEWR